MVLNRSEQPIVIQQAAPVHKEALTVVEAAESLSLGRTTVFRLIRERRLKVVRCGRALIIPRTEIRAFLDREIAKAFN